MHRMLLITGLVIIGLTLLSACAEEDSATDAIERYIKARIAGSEEELIQNSCPTWETEAIAAAASFQSVDAKVEGLSCKKIGTEGDYTLVTCEGTIVIQYQGEDPRNQDVPNLTYRAIKQDGEWKMCGTLE